MLMFAIIRILFLFIDSNLYRSTMTTATLLCSGQTLCVESRYDRILTLLGLLSSIIMMYDYDR